MILKISFVIALFGILIAFYYNFVYNSFVPEMISGKRVLLTGASSGIGEQMAYYYSELGAQLVITARRENLLKKVAFKCKQLGARKIEYVIADLAIPENRQKLMKSAEKHLGGLDYLILNHANLEAKLWKESPENMTSLTHLINLNFLSFVELASISIPILMKSQGSIGVVSSGAAEIVSAFGQSYGASKAALQAFFSAYREELKYRKTGVSVTIVTLAYIATENAMNVMNTAFPGNPWVPEPTPADDAARNIVEGVAARLPIIYHPVTIWFGVLAHGLLPTQFESFAAAKLFQYPHPN